MRARRLLPLPPAAGPDLPHAAGMNPCESGREMNAMPRSAPRCLLTPALSDGEEVHLGPGL